MFRICGLQARFQTYQKLKLQVGKKNNRSDNKTALMILIIDKDSDDPDADVWTANTAWVT